MCMWFWYNTLIIHFFCFVNLNLFFWHEMLSKCMESRYFVGATPLTVFLQFETLQMCSAWNKVVHVVLV